MSCKISVLGAGAWGTCIANLLACNGNSVMLWCYEQDVANDIGKNYLNSKYLPGISLSKNLSATTNLSGAICFSEWVFEAVPVKFLRTIFEDCKTNFTSNHKIVVLSKGIENDSFMLPSQVVNSVLGDCCLAVVAGPSFAQELAEKKQTAVNVACADVAVAESLASVLDSDYFKTILSCDVIGTQVGGALKNVIALASGILDGAGFGQNAAAQLITRGFSEISKLSTFFGGKPQTVYGLSGFGDVLLCCTGTLSKNFNAGKMLGSGSNLNDIKDDFKGVLPEGFNTAESVRQIIEKEALNLSVLKKAHDCIFDSLPAKDLLVF
jgi:glycerol-3-phosphate dehydrogenase (NAD(P)+)